MLPQKVVKEMVRMKKSVKLGRGTPGEAEGEINGVNTKKMGRMEH